MKKKIVAMLLVMCLGTTALAGCTNKEDKKEENKTTTESMIPAEELDQYVKLGEYKGITLEKTISEVTEESVEQEVQYALSANPIEVTDENAVVQEQDTVDLAFEGKVDGETFEGGSSDSYNLVIGSGSFIDGFEDGMIGMKKGESRDLNLTFPENYTEDLAGKPVVFHVTVNAIKRPQAQIDDTWVQNNSDFQTVDEYKADIRKNLEADAQENAEVALKSSAIQTVVENSEILEYPESELREGEEIYEQNLNAIAQMFGMELKDYLAQQEISEEDYQKQKEEYAKSIAASSLVMQAIAKEEGLTEEDQEYKDLLASYMEGSDLSEKEFLEQYGESNVKKTILTDRVCKIIIDNATINEVSAEAGTDNETAEQTE